MVKVDLRTITLNVPPQEVITKDNVPVRVNAVAYFRIVKPEDAIVQVENFMIATSQIAQTTLRSVLGQHSLDELLSEREKINAILQGIIDEATAPWGIKVSIVEVKDVEIPQGMQRAMARQAEAERERRAKVISAEGEFQASERLKDAALVIERHPVALQLRYLQTLIELGSSPATTIVFPMPIELLEPFIDKTLTPDLRHDPRSGRWSAIAPGRRARPGAASPSDGACPFCAGNEHLTPPETLRLGAGPTGWDVRVVPNLYPALERQEVVIHGPAHVESFGDLPDSTVAAVAEAWQRRARDVGGNCFAFVNEGDAAGASQHHSHSQLAWLPEARSVGRAASRRPGTRAGRPPAHLPVRRARPVRALHRPAGA